VEHARAQQIGSDRLTFAAEVRATELHSGREIWGETANLSKGGCYVRTREAFSQGTLLAIEIRHQGVHFLTDAMVAYTLKSNGMGVSFLNVPATGLPILEQWLSSAGASASSASSLDRCRPP
jgi:PilZ domain